jgi:riboflavin synthase
MFTGIVQETGVIRGRAPAGDAVRFAIDAPGLAPRLAVGDSVCCDGVCLTVETRRDDGFTACAVPETLAKTTLDGWAVGDPVNLESALTAATPLGGHFVLGHADGTCTVTETRDLGPGGEAGRELEVRLPDEFAPYCVYKGSICLSGVSLTIAAVPEGDGARVRVALIPHTLEATTLKRATAGARLNFEVDILAKHVERQLAARFGTAGARP